MKNKLFSHVLLDSRLFLFILHYFYLVGRRLVPATSKSHFACISQSDNMIAKSCVTEKRVFSMGKQSDEHGLRERVECEREMVKNRVTCSAKTCLRGNLVITKRRRVDDSEILIRRTNYCTTVHLPGLAGSSGRGKQVPTDRCLLRRSRSIAGHGSRDRRMLDH